MTSATDIITYVGVPLAVVGVLPILYTFVRAILTLRSIRNTLLRHGHIPATNARPDGFTTRSSPMTSLIEVDLPRYAIAPLDRSHPEYWKVDASSFAGDRHALLRTESTLSMIEEGRVRGFLRGGSWRTFHWKKLVVGRKLYRIQWEDQLREPPAEIDFSDLVHFLMDWGAVPNAGGWEKLKHGGLWTPGGTVLLQREDERSEKMGLDWVLRTSIPDESDGVLSLSVRWNILADQGESERGVTSLPPGWARLVQPGNGACSDQIEEKGLIGRIEQARRSLPSIPESESVKFCIEGACVSKVLWEHDHKETGKSLALGHECPETGISLWFTCAASALSRRAQVGGGLWGFERPSHIVNFVRKESVPCGVMVILGIVADVDTAPWSVSVPEDPNQSNPAFRHHRRFMESQRRRREEEAMPPAQASIARRNRMVEEQQALHDDMMADMRQRTEREEGRLRDAFASTRLSNKAVAEGCLAWMIDQEEVQKDTTLQGFAEAVLYLLIVDQRPEGEGAAVIQVLDEWLAWSQHGGMKKSHMAFLGEKKSEFCCAAALVYMIEEATYASSASGEVMKECIRSWRKIRVG